MRRRAKEEEGGGGERRRRAEEQSGGGERRRAEEGRGGEQESEEEPSEGAPCECQARRRHPLRAAPLCECRPSPRRADTPREPAPRDASCERHQKAEFSDFGTPSRGGPWVVKVKYWDGAKTAPGKKNEKNGFRPSGTDYQTAAHEPRIFV